MCNSQILCNIFLWILCRYSTLFLEIKIQGLQNLQIYYIQIYKHLALTVSDIRINGKISSNSEKCRHLLHRRGTWMLSPEAKLNLSQISAKYLINNTPNCFVPDAAVVSVKLGNSSAEKSLFLHHLGGARLVHHFCTNSVQAGQFCAKFSVRRIIEPCMNPSVIVVWHWHVCCAVRMLVTCKYAVTCNAMMFYISFFYSYVHLYITIYRDCSCGKQY